MVAGQNVLFSLVDCDLCLFEGLLCRPWTRPAFAGVPCVKSEGRGDRTGQVHSAKLKLLVVR